MGTSYNTPKAMAESMLKRFLQFKRAFSSENNNEVFQSILDNRYKLLGNLVSAAERRAIVLSSNDSLSLLTLNTMVAEDDAFKSSLKDDKNKLEHVLNEIHKIISKEVKTEKKIDTILTEAINLYS